MGSDSVTPVVERGSCPDANALAQVFVAALADERAAELDAHLDGCSDCRMLVSQLARGRAMPDVPTAETEAEDALDREATYIDRYLLLERVGAGGMGEVYAAHDPELDRRIAIKLLHAGQEGATLQREAQAIARVVHENVISVFDVGTHGGDVFIAMELVAGTTLAAWLRERPRSQREIIDVFVRAGRGLAAAHAAGLVHRDFKPENVLVGRDGIVRVTDFGLAGRPGDREIRGGTAGYMAPEQRAGADVDARVDQFAFCVALEQALDAPPAWLRRTLARGRDDRPAMRFASMNDLLAAVLHDPRRRWHRLSAGLAALAVIGVAGALVQRNLSAASSPVCTGASARIAETWNPSRARRIHAAFLASGKPYAEAAWGVFERGIDRYRDGWVAMHTEACLATRVRREHSEQLLDERMACLEDRRGELAGFVRVFFAPDVTAIESAGTAVQRLSSVESCGDVSEQRRAARGTVDPVHTVRVIALRARLAEARALDDASRFAAALPIVRKVIEGARAVGDKLLLADALLLEGDVLASKGDAPAAEPVLFAAIAAADAAGADEMRARGWTTLVRVLGTDRAKLEQARSIAELARATSERLGARPQLVANLAFALVPILTQAGELEAAERAAREALAIEEQIGGPDNLLLATALGYLANIQLAQGHYPEARALYGRELEIVERSLGADHPRVARTIDNRGISAFYAGHYADALADHERAIAISERALGPEHPDLAVSLGNAATAIYGLGETAKAAEYFARAIAVFERARDADHPTLATLHMNLGSAYAELERIADARIQYQRALGIQRRVLGPAHGDVGLTLAANAELFNDEGRPDEAVAEYRRALAIMELALGPGHPDVASALVGIGRSELTLDHRAAALVALERAVAIYQASEVAPEPVADARFALARALGRVPRGIDHARGALKTFAALGPPGVARATAVQAWLDGASR